MAGAEHLLNSDEEKYFESRGRHEPDGYGEGAKELGASGETGETETSESGGQELSERPDESLSEGDGAKDAYTRDDDTPEEIEHRPEARNKSSKRDFEKAYGVAESKRQELRSQLEQQSRYNQQLQQQLQALMHQQQGTQAKAPQVPDPNEDPLGYQAYQLENLNRTVSAQQQYLRQQQEQYQRQSQMQNFVNAYKASAVEFAKEAPDFNDAYKFLEQSRINEYMAAGYSQYEASQLLQEDEMALAAKAFRENVNPAERVYALARARGFNPPNSETRLEKVSKGMQKSKTLPRAGGKNMEKGYDISMIDEMSDDEFDKYFNQVKNDAKKNGDYKKDFY